MQTFEEFNGIQSLFWQELDEQQRFCLYERLYDEDHSPTDVYFCGNCWRSVQTNQMCIGFFVVLSIFFIFLTVIMIVYFRYQRLLATRDNLKAYYVIFALILAGVCSQIICMGDVLFNYEYDTQAFLLALPNACNFAFIAYAVSNFIQLDYLLRQE